MSFAIQTKISLISLHKKTDSRYFLINSNFFLPQEIISRSTSFPDPEWDQFIIQKEKERKAEAWTEAEDPV